MKKMINDSIWDHPDFISLEPRMKLLDRLMMEKLADKCGVVYFEHAYIESRLQVKLEPLEEIEEKLAKLWVRIDGNKFLRKDYLEETQGGSLYLYLPAHRVIFEAIAEHKKQGFENIVNAVRKANPMMEVQTMKEAYAMIELSKEKIQKNPNSQEAKGGQANINAFEKVERYFRYLGITDFPPVNDGFELDQDKEDKKPDTPSPTPAPQPSSTQWQKQPNPNRR
jgi:hypothetical protein